MTKVRVIYFLFILLYVPITGYSQISEGAFIPSTLNYEVLRSFEPYSVNEAIGMDILLKEDINSITEDDIIDFLQTISEGKKFVVISIFLTPEAYTFERSSDVDEGFLLTYVKNIMSVDIGTHRHQINWMQEKGKFQHKREPTLLPLEKYIIK